MKTKLTSAITSVFWCVNGALKRHDGSTFVQEAAAVPSFFLFFIYFILFFIFSFLFLLHRVPLIYHPIRPSCWPPPRGQCWGSFSVPGLVFCIPHSLSHYSLPPLCYNNASASLTSPIFFLSSVFFSSCNSTIFILNPILLLSLSPFVPLNESLNVRDSVLHSCAVTIKPRVPDTSGIGPLSVHQDMQHLSTIAFPWSIDYEGTIYNCCYLQTSLWPTWLEYVNTLFCRRIFSRGLVVVGFLRFFIFDRQNPRANDNGVRI